MERTKKYLFYAPVPSGAYISKNSTLRYLPDWTYLKQKSGQISVRECCCCFQWGTEEKSSQLAEYRRQAPMVLTFPGK